MAVLARVRRADFSTLLLRGKSVQSPLYKVIFTPHSGDFCFTAVVSKKTVRHAVDRNYEKRRVRGILREFEKTLISGALCAVFVKSGARTQSYQALRSDLADLFEKAHLFKHA